MIESVCVCERESVCACMCVCVCVRETDAETKRERQRERHTERHRETQRGRMKSNDIRHLPKVFISVAMKLNRWRHSEFHGINSKIKYA